MKKKTLAMFVALTLTSGLLAGCGNAEKALPQQQKQQQRLLQL